MAITAAKEWRRPSDCCWSGREAMPPWRDGCGDCRFLREGRTRFKSAEKPNVSKSARAYVGLGERCDLRAR